MLLGLERDFFLTGSYVDVHDEVRLSALLTFMQDVAGEHSTLNGFSRTYCLGMNLVWIINRYHIIIERMPMYFEKIRIKTWVGKTSHVAFTRYFEVLAEDGTSLVKVASVWSVIEQTERKLIQPAKYGIVFESSVTGSEIPQKAPVEHLEITDSCKFTVPYSYIDQNGHMNNCRYMDLVDDVLCTDFEGRSRREIRIEYNNEIRRGEVINVEWGSREDGLVYIRGIGPEDKQIFKMNVQFE